MDVNHLCPYDQAKAKALLAEAGYGPQKPLTFELMADTEKCVFNVIATVIKEQMARIGVTANIRLVDKVSWMNTHAAGRAVGHVRRGPRCRCMTHRQQRLPVDQHVVLEPARATTTPRSTSTTPATRGRWTPAKRKAIAKEFQEFMADKHVLEQRSPARPSTWSRSRG